MTRLALVMPYYMNPAMLAHQYGAWRAYPEALKAQLQVVIVDDGSPVETAAEVARPEGLPRLEIYRVLEDRPWHQHGARNLGAHVAAAEWLLLTDMDHVFPADSLEAWLARLERHDVAYMFPRLDWPELKPTLGRYGEHKPHPNTFGIARDTYWAIGGYDEEFCGIYGTDGLFRERLRKQVSVKLARGCPVYRFTREIIADASTRTLDRKEGRNPHAKREVRNLKKREGRRHEIRTLAFPWARVV